MAARLVYGEKDRLLGWACDRIGLDAFKSDAQAIGLEREGRLSGVVVFDGFSDTDCCLHVASDGSGHWLTPGFLRAVFAYVFIQCGFLRVTSPIAESNVKALRFNLHLGFEREGYHPYMARDGAVITTGLTRDRCRFIPKEYRHMRNN